MHLIALEDVADSIGTIAKGQEFHVVNDDHAQYLIRTQRAKPYENRWDGLDWRSCSVVICASGPSLSEEQCVQVKAWQSDAHRVMAINTSFRRAPFADVVYGCDSRWWDVYGKEVGETCTHSEFWTQDAKCKGIKRIESHPSKGLNRQKGVINQGNNGGYQAIGLAYQAGSKRIILLGYDMKGGHWHGDHPAGLNSKANFDLWIRNFEELAKDLKEEGIEVLNATPKTALHCFPKIELEQALK